MKSASKRVPLRWMTLLAASISVAPRAAAAAEATVSAPRETAIIATSLVTPFFGAYYLEGKVRTSSSLAMVVSTSYLSLEDGDWKHRAGTVGAGVNYFFEGLALRGWYLEAIGEVWFSSARHEPSAGVAPIGLGSAGVALAGHQFVFDCGAAIDLGAGVLVFHLPEAQVGSVSSEPLTRIYPVAKVHVGWAF